MLNIIVPICRMAGKLSNLKQWMSEIREIDIKVILIEDGKDLPTLTELRSILAQFDSDQVTILSGIYGSPGAARNAGLELIDSGWVAFWDSDDLPNPKKVVEMVNVAQHQNSQIAVGKFYVLESQFHNREKHLPEGSEIIDFAMNPGLWRWVFHASVIHQRRFSEHKMGEDQLFLQEVKVFSRQITYFNDAVYGYSVGVQGQLTSSTKAVSDLLKVVPMTFNRIDKSFSQQKSFDRKILCRQIITGLKRLRNLNKLQMFFILIKYLTLKPNLFFDFCSIVRKSKINVKSKSGSRNLFVSLTGGLGNQLFQLAAAMEVAGDRKVTLIDSLGKPRRNSLGKAEIESFVLPKNVISGKGRESWISGKVTGYLLRSGIWPNGIEKLSAFRLLTRYFGKVVLSNHLHTEVFPRPATSVGYENFGLSFEKDELLIGYFQSAFWVRSPKVHSILKGLTLINPGPELQKLKVLSESEKPVIVHVRLTDYRQEETFGLLGLGYYSRALDIQLRAQNTESIWVFSDEIEFAREVIPEKFHSQIRWIFEVDNSATATFEAMRLGQSYIIANSTFSWWAATLSKNPFPTVIAPDPWFVGQSSPAGLIHPNWISVPRLEPPPNIQAHA
jgi:glycosyltransferase involved in cell wall biosynthesis